MDKYKVVPVVNHYCHRVVYFVLLADYDFKHKSLEQIYDDSVYASFLQKEAGREAIRLNLQ